MRPPETTPLNTIALPACGMPMKKEELLACMLALCREIPPKREPLVANPKASPLLYHLLTFLVSFSTSLQKASKSRII
jgi:hypothetical protein